MVDYPDELDYVFQDEETGEWFYLDVDEQANGPYYSESRALDGLHDYMEYLDGKLA